MGDAEAETLDQRLAAMELAITGHILADVVTVSRERLATIPPTVALTMEALTVEAA